MIEQSAMRWDVVMLDTDRRDLWTCRATQRIVDEPAQRVAWAPGLFGISFGWVATIHPCGTFLRGPPRVEVTPFQDSRLSIEHTK